jgi:ABC-2 type transport system permease protein
MLLLLASIFFSGFFMDLRMMKEPITVLAWSLPATYGIRMLQDIMLRGSSLPLQVFLGIAGIGMVLFLIDWTLLRKKWKVNTLEFKMQPSKAKKVAELQPNLDLTVRNVA